jgi:DNA helicase HerA-like ATPase
VSRFAQHVAIAGAAGTGKTHLLAVLVRQLVAAGGMTTVIVSPYSEGPLVTPLAAPRRIG